MTNIIRAIAFSERWQVFILVRRRGWGREYLPREGNRFRDRKIEAVSEHVKTRESVFLKTNVVFLTSLHYT